MIGPAFGTALDKNVDVRSRLHADRRLHDGSASIIEDDHRGFAAVGAGQDRINSIGQYGNPDERRITYDNPMRLFWQAHQPAPVEIQHNRRGSFGRVRRTDDRQQRRHQGGRKQHVRQH